MGKGGGEVVVVVGGDLLLLLPSVRLVWPPLRAAAEATVLLYPFVSLRLFFPPPCPRVGGEKLEAPNPPPPPQANRDLLGLKQAAALLFPLDLHGALIQDILLRAAAAYSILQFFFFLFSIVFGGSFLCWVHFDLDLLT